MSEQVTCDGCGAPCEPENIIPCPVCGRDKCPFCNMGKNVPCVQCDEEEDTR